MPSTRGATQAGYAVIFLTRTGSLQPFSQMLPAADPPEVIARVAMLQPPPAVAPAEGSLDGKAVSASSSGGADADNVVIRPEQMAALARVLRAQQACREHGTLLIIKYETIFDYLTVSGGDGGLHVSMW